MWHVSTFAARPHHVCSGAKSGLFRYFAEPTLMTRFGSRQRSYLAENECARAALTWRQLETLRSKRARNQFAQAKFVKRNDEDK
jgi:hypothetical protein